MQGKLRSVPKRIVKIYTCTHTIEFKERLKELCQYKFRRTVFFLYYYDKKYRYWEIGGRAINYKRAYCNFRNFKW